jgi:hypothetical protein
MDNIISYEQVAEDILNLLENYGFTTNMELDSQELKKSIANIIKIHLEKNDVHVEGSEDTGASYHSHQ